MSIFRSAAHTSAENGGRLRDGADRWWLLLVLVAALLPSLSILSILVLVTVTNSLDPAFELGVSDTFFNGLIVAMSGGLTGLFAGRLAKVGGWKLVMPPMAALIIGLAIFVAFAAFGLGTEVDNHVGSLATIWIGQAAGIILATRVAGLTLAGAAGVVVVLGIGAAGAIGAVPEQPAEILLILENYEDDAQGEECWGAGELSQFVEGSRLFLLELPETVGPATEVESIRLPTGSPGEGGCVFELGNPLGGTAADYENIALHHESDPDVGMGSYVEDHRMIYTFGGG